MSFKRFLIWGFDSPAVHWRGIIYANLKEGIMGNVHVKGSPFVQQSITICAILVEGIKRNNSVKIF